MSSARTYNTQFLFLSLNPRIHDDFLADFYDYNSFGIEHKNHDGLAIFRNTYAQDPYVRIMTFGEAQLYLYDTRYDDLIDGVKSYFIGNDYKGATKYILNYYERCVNKGQL